MKKQIAILLVLWGFFSSGVGVYLWNSNQELQTKNQSLNNSISLHKKLIGVEFESYKIINDCFVVNRGMCSTKEFESKLKILSDEAESLYDQISILENEKH